MIKKILCIFCCLFSTMHYAMEETVPAKTNNNIELSQEKNLLHDVKAYSISRLQPARIKEFQFTVENTTGSPYMFALYEHEYSDSYWIEDKVCWPRKRDTIKLCIQNNDTVPIADNHKKQYLGCILDDHVVKGYSLEYIAQEGIKRHRFPVVLYLKITPDYGSGSFCHDIGLYFNDCCCKHSLIDVSNVPSIPCYKKIYARTYSWLLQIPDKYYFFAGMCVGTCLFFNNIRLLKKLRH